MKIKEIQLWDGRPELKMTAYLTEPSEQYHQDKRRSAVLVCPGGGFRYMADRESEPVALAYAVSGFQAFTLSYTTNRAFPACLFDAAKAVQLIREHADEWMIDPDRVAIEGMSAGGYLAVALPALSGTGLFEGVPGLDAGKIKPNAAVAGYPALDLRLSVQKEFTDKLTAGKNRKNEQIVCTALGGGDFESGLYHGTNPLEHITKSMCPVFVWTTNDDKVVPPLNTAILTERLLEAGVPVESHVFGWGQHSMSLATPALKRGEDTVDPHIAKWFEMSVEWLYRIFEIN